MSFLCSCAAVCCCCSPLHLSLSVGQVPASSLRGVHRVSLTVWADTCLLLFFIACIPSLVYLGPVTLGSCLWVRWLVVFICVLVPLVALLLAVAVTVAHRLVTV